MIKRLEIKLK